ncbi:hypothetical protein ABG067_006553 [Albugo candida]
MYIPSQSALPHSQREEDFDRIKQTSQSNFPSYAWNRSNWNTLVHVTNERFPRTYDLDDCLESESVPIHSISQPISTYCEFDPMAFSSIPIEHSIETTTAYDSPSNTAAGYGDFNWFQRDPYNHAEHIAESICYEEPMYDDKWVICRLDQDEDIPIQMTEPVTLMSGYMYDDVSSFASDVLSQPHEPVIMQYSNHSNRPFKRYVLRRPTSEKQYAVGRWNPQEHELFLRGLEIFKGPAWGDIAKLIGSRSSTQVRTHAQKFFTKLARSNRTFPHFEGHIDRERQRLAGQGALLRATSANFDFPK